MAILEDETFKGCISLTTLSISSYGNEIDEISESAFEGCTNLVLKVKKDSVAYEYAVRENIPYELKSQEEVAEEIEAFLKKVDQNVKDNYRERKEYVDSLIN